MRALVGLCLLVLLSLLRTQFVVPVANFPKNGVPSTNFPLYDERALQVWTNFIRIDPSYYLTTYINPRVTDSTKANVFASGTLNAKPPIYYNLNLARAARAHVTDVLTNCKTNDPSHNDCNGTSAGTRIAKFYSGGWGEIYFNWPLLNFGGSGGAKNLPSWSFWAMAAFTCDGPLSTSTAMTSCPVDANAGHRRIIMTQDGEVGCGWIVASDYSQTIVTCNFGSSATVGQVYTNVTIYSAAHIFMPAASSFVSTKYKFISNYYSKAGASPSSAVVYFNGTRYSMTRTSGVASRGNYETSADWTTDNVSPCMPYHFEFTTNGVMDRYPAVGEFYTKYVGTCTQEYTPTNADSPAPKPGSSPSPSDSNKPASGDSVPSAPVSFLLLALASILTFLAFQ